MSAFAIYRLPHEDHATMIRQTKGEPVELHSITELNGKQGFVVAPFEVKDDQPVMLIEGEKTIVPLEATQFIMSSVPPSVMSSVPPSVMSSVSPSVMSSVSPSVMSSGVETSHGFMPIGEAKTSSTEIHEISPRASCVPSVASEQSSNALGRDDKPLTSYYKVDFANYHSQLKNDTFRKIVLARCADEKTEEKLDPMALFYKACAMYPRLFIALVETEKSGCWLTATPEILLDGKGSDWRTIALAGTMKLEDDQLNGEGETLTWSTKNIQEQRIVSTYITECLEQFTSNFSEEGPKTVRAANLVHLRSDFTFKLEDNNHIGDLLNTLHPTPAVCGLPKREAFQFIVKNEHTPRRYYSGFMGPLGAAETHLYVSLRCMNIDGDTFHLYAGGGLLKDSTEEQEWLETEAKMETMRKLLYV